MNDRFSGKWVYLFATLSMAIGTGNIWRFPRLLGTYGGITFIIPWAIFLFLWSIPLLVVENALGSRGHGLACTFRNSLGKNGTSGGIFVALVTFMIASYYSVVTGWCAGYFAFSFSGHVWAESDLWKGLFEGYFSRGSLTLLLHLFSAGIASLVVLSGVRKGIERMGRVVIPILFVILVYLVFWSLTSVDPELKGLKNVLTFKRELFFNPELWIQALSQSAWSTGAGWGLLLTYASRSPEGTDFLENATLTGAGNNLASLFAGVAVVSIIFGLLPHQEASQAFSSGNTGLSFIYLPALFAKVPLGRFSMALFFLALFMAALSSLISMFELVTFTLSDFGISRRAGALVTFTSAFLMGIPSALSTNFLNNQDWVWGLGLILSGSFIWLAGVKNLKYIYQAVKERTQWKGFSGMIMWFFKYLVPLQAVTLLTWWLLSSGKLLSPFSEFSAGTCIFQWFTGGFLCFFISKHFRDKLKCKG